MNHRVYTVDFVIGNSYSVEEYVRENLGEYADDFDVDAIVDDFRNEINNTLDDDGILNGDEFFGLSHPDLDVAELVESIDFWAIVERHQIAE